MSSDIKTPEKKSRKHKDGAETKSSRKRKHEQDAEAQTAGREDSPVKKQKKEKKEKKEKKHSKSQDPQDTTTVISQQEAGSLSQPTASIQPVVEDSDLESHSPFVQKTASLYLALSPVAYHKPLEGLCAEHISPLLLTYYPPLKGVVLSYSNPRLSEHPSQGLSNSSDMKMQNPVLSRSVDEYAVTYIWLTAEFTLFKPSKATVLEGYVNLQNEGILGLMCYNYFNAGILRNRLPSDWKWVNSEGGSLEGNKRKEKTQSSGDGYFVDGYGQKVDGRIVFRVRDFEAGAQSETGTGTINILGSLLSQDDDRKVDADEREKGKKKAKS